MSLLDQIQINKKLPYPKDQDKMEQRYDYYEDSYNCSESYVDSKDSKGNPIIVKFECETSSDYSNRKRLTHPRNYCSFILNKYNSSVFLNEPSRSKDIPDYLLKSADGLSTSLNDLMKDQLLDAQIYGSSYVLIDINIEGEFFLRKIEIDEVIPNYVNGKLLEVIVELEDEEGNCFARYYNKTDYIDIIINENDIVQSISSPQPHGFKDIPLGGTTINFGDNAQISPIAQGQKQVANYLSLLNQEIVDSTFTKFFISGVRLPDQTSPEGSRNAVNFSSKRLIMFEDAGATLQKIGADITQADSIDARIKSEEQSIFRTSGLSNYSWDSEGAVQLSGVSRLLSMVDFFSTCHRLKCAIQATENYILSLIGDVLDLDIAHTDYSDKYVANDYSADIADLRDVLSLDLPDIVKAKAKLEFVQKYYTLSESDTKLAITQLSIPQKDITP